MVNSFTLFLLRKPEIPIQKNEQNHYAKLFTKKKLVPPKGVLPLFDPVLDITPNVVALHRLFPGEPGIGHEE